MGGQVGDSGWLITEDGNGVEIRDTKRENNLPVHIMSKLPEDVTCNFLAKINTEKRAAAEANHTATHLLHKALRDLLGSHVEQKGSFVSPEVLRFDFSHFQKVTPEELRAVEHAVNKMVRQNIALDEHRNLPIEEAKAMGAMALFGEKYGDSVRVVRYGDSIELCGGTHASATGNIGLFRIVSESSIAAGVRRIEAVTAEYAELLIDEMQDNQTSIKELLNNTPDVLTAIKKNIEESADLRKKVENFMQERAMMLRDSLVQRAEEIGDIKVIRHISNENPDTNKVIVPFFRGKFADVKFMYVSGNIYEGKPSLTIFLSQPMVDAGFNAGKLVREAAKFIQGGGGGQAFMATAGGKNPDGMDEAINYIIEAIK